MTLTVLKRLSVSKLITLSTVLLLSVYSASATAQRISASDDGKEAIAKFVLNFGRFIDWPDSAFSSGDAAFKVCIIGENHLGAELEQALSGKSAGKRDFAIQELAGGQLEEAKACQLLYISASEESRVGEISGAVSGLPILTVGETDNFPENGGMIGLADADGRVAVRMARSVIEAANLNVRSQLMRAIQ
ncbi:MAG: YfiR family protein [Pseudohongiellaceae bacterium]|nr:YfiR family protein [Pseudohongiellaceae bacterium]